MLVPAGDGAGGEVPAGDAHVVVVADGGGDGGEKWIPAPQALLHVEGDRADVADAVQPLARVDDPAAPQNEIHGA